MSERRGNALGLACVHDPACAIGLAMKNLVNTAVKSKLIDSEEAVALCLSVACSVAVSNSKRGNETKGLARLGELSARITDDYLQLVATGEVAGHARGGFERRIRGRSIDLPLTTSTGMNSLPHKE